MDITLRAYNDKDFSALETIIRKTWHYDEFCSPDTAKKLANVFLSSCLTNYTYSCVAFIDENPVGIILGKNIAKHHCSWKSRWKQIKALISLYSSKEGRRVSKIFESVSGIDTSLLNECKEEYPAELALFAVDPVCRGKGIGKILFQSLLDYMRQEKLDNFYLFTDTSCNYGFYEHQGMTRRCKKNKVFHIQGQDANMSFFIYDYEV